MAVQIAHAVDYSAPNCDGARACQNEIVRFVTGIRRPRKAPVSAAQIRAWFKATPDDFVNNQMDAALAAGRIRIVHKSLSSSRRANGAYAYEPAPKSAP